MVTLFALLDFFSKKSFMPHGHCYLWKPEILWLHVVSDTIIAISYFSIPILLYYFVARKKDFPEKNIIQLFSAFIFWCGLTHLISIWTVWDPVYQIEGLAKGVTAGISFFTALALIPIIPRLLNLRSPSELQEINQKLRQTLAEKESAKQSLTDLNKELEENVQQRTRELAEYAKRLATANEELESFAHRASHDLKSPIGSLISYLDLIKESDDDKEEMIESLLPRMDKQLKQLNQLISDLLDLSRIGSDELEPEWIQASELVDDVKVSLHHKIESKSAKIYSDLSMDIYGVKSQLQMVFQNIIENALKYCSESTPPEIIISGTQVEPNKWVIYIKDNGIGIAPEYHDEIFKPFKRLHSNDEYVGTGLGLSICKKVVENHGGKITLQSSLGQGSTFQFSIVKKS